MKKNCFSRFSIVIFGILVLVPACSTPEAEPVDQCLTAPIFYASQENTPEARSSLTVNSEGVGKILWSPADEISVYYGASTGVRYTSTNLEPAAEASFTTTAIIGSNEGSSRNIWGLYPYNPSAVCNGSSVTTTLPSTQYAVPGSFDDDLFITLAHSDNTNLHFFNVCGGIKFTLSRDDITSITFAGNNGEDLAGDISASFVEGLPSVAVQRGEKTIVLTPKTGGTFAKDTEYYLVVLPQTLSGGFTMTFETESQLGTFNYSTSGITLKRSVFSKKDNIDSYAVFVDKQHVQPANVIYYTSIDGSVITPCFCVPDDPSADLTPYIYSAFQANIVSNQYSNGIGTITFDRDLTSISSHAFFNDGCLTSVKIPDSVYLIDQGAFDCCNNLHSVTLPQSLSRIGQMVFYSCTSLDTIVLPEGLISIGPHAFNGCRNLTSLSFPNSLIEVGDDAFRYCDGLISVIVPATIDFGEGVFSYCKGLNSITFSEGVTTIPGYICENCINLSSVTIPNTVSAIRRYAFDGCSALNEIVILSTTPPTGGYGMFGNTNNCPIYVPAESVEAYKTANYWRNYANRIQAIEE